MITRVHAHEDFTGRRQNALRARAVFRLVFYIRFFDTLAYIITYIYIYTWLWAYIIILLLSSQCVGTVDNWRCCTHAYSRGIYDDLNPVDLRHASIQRLASEERNIFLYFQSRLIIYTRCVCVASIAVLSLFLSVVHTPRWQDETARTCQYYY